MNKHEIECAVMFVDIAGSTRLYEILGDEKAQDIISCALQLLSAKAITNGGTVIKNIGDEIMCRFSNADDAIQAATDIHETLEEQPLRTASVPQGLRLSVRIGLHYGSSILEQNDLFGDAVNVAARMTAIAKAGQIITTAQTVGLLTTEQQTKTRIFDRITLKGKTDKVDVYEVLWHEQEDLTRVVTAAIRHADLHYQQIHLHYCGEEWHLDRGCGDFVLGRDKNCNVVVLTELVSRQHCVIKYNRGKFVLVDCSTNGSYVRYEEGEDVYIKREELPLWGKGLISLGGPVDDNMEDLIAFSCT